MTATKWKDGEILSDDYIVTYSGDKYITYDVIPITEFL
jgi:hypothetical protein